MAIALLKSTNILWGFFDPTDWQGSNNGIPTYQAIDKAVGQAQSMTAPQLSWANGNNADGSLRYQYPYLPRLDADRQAGRVSFLNWLSLNLASRGDLRLSANSVAAGAHDAYITKVAQVLAGYGHPIHLRLNPEMNGWWEGPFSEYDSTGKPANGNQPGDFVKSWQRIFNIFQQQGATNVAFNWCCNQVDATGAGPTSAKMLPSFFPGLDYVHTVGFDVYNQAADGNVSWLTFQQVMEGRASGWPGNTMAAILALAPGVPWLLGEVGCCATAMAGDTTAGAGDKTGWIKDMLTLIPKRYPFIYGFIWFNWDPYTITLPPAAATAMGAVIGADARYLKAGQFPVGLDKALAAPYVVVSTPDLDAQVLSLQAQVSALQAQLAASQAQATGLTAQLTSVQSQLAAVQTSLQQEHTVDLNLQSQLTTAQTSLGVIKQALQVIQQAAQ